jgi:hypothetical protein
MSHNLPLFVAQLVVDAVDSPSTLVSLACANRALCEIALDKIWYRLDNLYALAKCMPLELWDEYEVRGESYWMVNRVVSTLSCDIIGNILN